jgi:hypothetical protein
MSLLDMPTIPLAIILGSMGTMLSIIIHMVVEMIKFKLNKNE